MMSRVWPRYEDVFVLDMLADVGTTNLQMLAPAPLSPKMLAAARASGITACNMTVGVVGTDPLAFEKTLASIGFWEQEINSHPDTLLQVRGCADIEEAKRTHRLGVIFGFQDGTMLEADVGRVRQFHDRGIRIMQLTYNGPNQLGAGCVHPDDRGLTDFGRQCIDAMNELGILVDVSHVGLRTAWDALSRSKVPIAVTHSGARVIANLPRNKPDDLLKAVADRGGVVGIYLMPYLREEGQPHASDFMRHLSHLLDVCGEDHVGVGSDLSTSPVELTPEYRAAHANSVRERRRLGIGAPSESEDVFTYVPEFNSPRRLALIADAMLEAGYTAGCVEKVIGGNWMRLLAEVW
jgi:membrane dipeptidase